MASKGCCSSQPLSPVSPSAPLPPFSLVVFPPNRVACETWKRPFCATATSMLAIGPPVLPPLRAQSQRAALREACLVAPVQGCGAQPAAKDTSFFLSLSLFFSFGGGPTARLVRPAHRRGAHCHISGAAGPAPGCPSCHPPSRYRKREERKTLVSPADPTVCF